MSIKYKIDYFNQDGQLPTTEPEKTIAEIVLSVMKAISNLNIALAKDDKKVHPKTMISVVVSNILGNLLFDSVHSTDIKTRLSMVDECIIETMDMTYALWSSYELKNIDTPVCN